MKRFLMAAAIVGIISCFGCGSEQLAGDVEKDTVGKPSNETVDKTVNKTAGATAPQAGKYGIKSGILHFDVTDFAGAHKEIVYFDDYGRKECQERLDADGAVAEIRFCDGKQMVNLNPEEKTAYILSANASTGTEMRFDKNGFTARQKEKYHYQNKPDMTVAGKNCEAFYMETGSGKTIFAGWSHITLYHNQETRYGNILREVTLLEENVPVARNKFEIPSGFAVQKAF